MAVAVVALRMASLSTRRHMKGVADFLSANRSANRYLLTIASQMGGIGVVTIVGGYEVMNRDGIAPGWWGALGIPAADYHAADRLGLLSFQRNPRPHDGTVLRDALLTAFQDQRRYPMLCERYSQLRHLPGCGCTILRLLLRSAGGTSTFPECRT